MKIYKHKILQRLSVVCIVLAFIGCQNHLEELNVNPNGLETVDDAALFSKASRSLLLFTANTASFKFAGQYSHQIVCGNTARNADAYTDGFDNDYAGIYSNILEEVLKQTTDALEITASGDTANEVRNAILNVVEVVAFSKLTDMYGAVPYHEAAEGKNGILSPKYNTQQEIYDDMVKRLTASIAILKNADASKAYPGVDPVFDNDMDKWTRFANSYKLRLAMRIKNVNAAQAKTLVEECLANPLMETNDHNAALGVFPDVNPWYNYTHVWPEVKVSSMFLNHLQASNDPRLSALVSKNAADAYQGVTNGLSDQAFAGADFGGSSNLGDAVIGTGSKLYLMTASEIWLLRAEAALLLMNDEPLANTNYQNGLAASFGQWNVDGAAFMASPLGNLTGTVAEKESQINTQLWVSLTPDFLESWFHIRRTGQPEIAQRTGDNLKLGVTNGIMPNRFLYFTLEMSTNGANVQAAIDAQGPNKIDTKLWWDKQ